MSNIKEVVLVSLMAALGNALSLFLSLQLMPGIVVHLSQAPPLLVAVGLGPLPGAVTGALASLGAAYIISIQGSSWNLLFIPIGNAILCYVAGVASRRGLNPLFSSIIGEVAEAPWIYFTTGIILMLPQQVVLIIIGKALIEVCISGLIVQILMSIKVIEDSIKRIGGK